MYSNNKRVLLWTTALAQLLNNEAVGGIGVQMFLWAKEFSKHGWKVFSLYRAIKPQTQNFCSFYKDIETKNIYLFLYFFITPFILLKIKPKIVITRGGANRNLFFISLWCRLLNIKHLQFFGSDKDLTQEYVKLTRQQKFNYSFFLNGIKLTKYIVVQNEYQKKSLIAKYSNKNILIIPNIWEGEVSHLESMRDYILWVGNTRGLKRPQWVFKIAESLPDEKFIIIGGNADNKVYNECIELGKKSNNVIFKGALTFEETNSWFEKAKVLLCTSEYEGFPNTFLQAWSNCIPVFSTVDPSDVIEKYGLGKICQTPSIFIQSLKEILNTQEYTNLQENINKYFIEAHAPKSNYFKLINFISK